MVVDLLATSSAPFLITFREALEAALIIGIIAAYLTKTGKADAKKYLWIGSGIAIAVSIALGFALLVVYGGLAGIGEKLFEGTAAILAAGILTYMIFWMGKNARNIKDNLQKKVDVALSRGYLLGITGIAFIAVLREGIETVLFLVATATIDITGTMIGAGLGVTIVVLLTILAMKRIYRLNLHAFFKYSSLLLIIFAAGLFGFGVHEYIEAAETANIDTGFLGMKAYDINPPDASHPLHEKGAIGSIAKALVGYDGNPEWLRVFAYLFYWIIVGAYFLRTYYPDHRVSRRLGRRKSF